MAVLPSVSLGIRGSRRHVSSAVFGATACLFYLKYESDQSWKNRRKDSGMNDPNMRSTNEFLALKEQMQTLCGMSPISRVHFALGTTAFFAYRSFCTYVQLCNLRAKDQLHQLQKFDVMTNRIKSLKTSALCAFAMPVFFMAAVSIPLTCWVKNKRKHAYIQQQKAIRKAETAAATELPQTSNEWSRLAFAELREMAAENSTGSTAQELLYPVYDVIRESDIGNIFRRG